MTRSMGKESSNGTMVEDIQAISKRASSTEEEKYSTKTGRRLMASGSRASTRELMT